MIVAALAGAAPDDGHRHAHPVVRRLEALIAAHVERLAWIPDDRKPFDLKARVQAYEWRLIAIAMEVAARNVDAAAHHLGLSPRGFYRKLRQAPASVWRPRAWPVDACDAAIVDVVVAGGSVTSLDIIARLPAPAYWTPGYRRSRVLKRLAVLVNRGTVQVTPGRTHHDPYRYAIAQRGAA